MPTFAPSNEQYQQQQIDQPQAVTQFVQKWCDRIRMARAHWDKDFKRMRSDMEFAAGYQWFQQEMMDDDRYVTNATLRQVNQKVANLYAKNPRFVSQMRKRLYYQIWDERSESLQQATSITSSPEAQPQDNFAASALIADYTNGNQTKHIAEKVGDTLEIALRWFVDNQTPSFKTQMKQMVRRTVITGVGYVKLDFARAEQGLISETEQEYTTADRLRMIRAIQDKLSNGEIDEDSPEIVNLQALMSSLQSFTGEEDGLDERLVFDFPMSTSIIIDPNCRALKGFIGAKWIAQEHIMDLDAVNAHFGTNIQNGGGITEYNARDGKPYQPAEAPQDTGEKRTKVCVWEVYDQPTRSRFFIMDGYDTPLLPPEPVSPETKNFWPIFPLTFNDVEVEPGQQKATIFPPSDVQLMRAPQKEWNRSREFLKKHRAANQPKYLTADGMLTEEDEKKLVRAQPNEIIKLKAVGPDVDVGKILIPFASTPIDPMVHDTSPLVQDMYVVNGNEGESTQPASTHGTATAATINEQSRMQVTSSNVDDLDDFLSDIGEAAGEIMIREISAETITRIVGPGAVWPQTFANREDFILWIFLKVQAGSSGRPNKALEISNFQQLAPLMLQAGVSPQFIIREAAKRLDDNIDLDELFDLGSTGMMPMMPPQQTPPANPSRGQVGPSQQNTMPAGTMPTNKMQGAQVG